MDSLKRHRHILAVLLLAVLALWGCAAAVRLTAGGAGRAALGARAGAGAAARVGAGVATAARAGSAVKPGRGVVGSRAVAPTVERATVRSDIVAMRGAAAALAREGRIPTGTAKVFSSGGQYVGLVEVRNGRALIYNKYGNAIAHARAQGSRINYYGASGRVLGHSHIRGTRIDHYYRRDGQSRFAGYDIISEDSVRHYDQYGRLIGETVLRPPQPGIPAELAIAAGAGSKKDERTRR